MTEDNKTIELIEDDLEKVNGGISDYKKCPEFSFLSAQEPINIEFGSISIKKELVCDNPDKSCYECEKCPFYRSK